MAVRPSTAAETRGDVAEGPQRTCIGCRQRAVAAELLRVVVAPGAVGSADSGPAGQSLPEGPDALPVVPDPRRRTPGRGAWLHCDPRCVDLAERRRAFGRALRVPGPIDPSPVREFIAAQHGDATRTAPQEL